MDYRPVYRGATTPLTTDPVVGTPEPDRQNPFAPGREEPGAAEIRVSILGSGMPWVTRAQASASVLVEVGNEQRDVFAFDLGSGALANFSALQVPMTSLTKVFFTHLHADHTSDFIALLGSYAKQGRLDPVEVWGGASSRPEWGVAAFVEHVSAAMSWDRASMAGYVPTSGFAVTATEVPYDRASTCYERNAVTITSFPVIHGLDGSVGYRLDYAGLSVTVSGDTAPTKTLVDAARGTDLLIHETFLPPETLAEVANVPIEQARAVVGGIHTTPREAGAVFSEVGPRMAAMWHTQVVDGYVEPVFTGVRQTYDGPVTLCQDLTVFNITDGSVLVRQARVDDAQSAVIGPSHHARTLSEPNPKPDWWAAARLHVD